MAVQYSHAHYVFRILGTFGQTASAIGDYWSTGFRLGNPDADAAVGVDLTTFLESVSTAVRTFHESLDARTGGNTWLRELTIARVGTNGKYDPQTQETTRRLYTTPVPGNGVHKHPWTASTVISLRTDIPRGIGSNGRTYWPTTAANIDPWTGRLVAGEAETFATAAAGLINSVNASASSSIGALTRVAVYGAAGKTGPARAAHVTHIRVDERLDAIERRENDQPPKWHQKDVIL